MKDYMKEKSTADLQRDNFISLVDMTLTEIDLAGLEGQTAEDYMCCRTTAHAIRLGFLYAQGPGCCCTSLQGNNVVMEA